MRPLDAIKEESGSGDELIAASGGSKSKRVTDRTIKRLRIFQIVVASLHFLQFVAASAVVATNTGWGQLRVGSACYPYRITWILPAFAFCSFLSHALTALNTRTIVLARVNVIRWVEYAVSSTLCNWVVCALVGIDELWQMVVAAALNVGVMATGAAIETSVRAGEDPRVWMMAGWAGFSALWAWIITKFALAVHDHDSSKEGAIPTFVLYGVPTGLVALNTMFGCVSLWYSYPHMTQQSARFPSVSDALDTRFARAEQYYSVLSLTAKSFLMWMVLSGAQRSGVTVCTN